MTDRPWWKKAKKREKTGSFNLCSWYMTPTTAVHSFFIRPLFVARTATALVGVAGVAVLTGSQLIVPAPRRIVSSPPLAVYR